uniref:Non-structural maintenance of chromosomes element 1 homolog n=1 Tax=Bos indicus x Bos taurus TaxID=30522 RepID=A0A4W2DVA6_BOBOX
MGGLDLRWQPMGAPYPRSPRLEGGAEPSFLPSSSSVWTALGRCAPPSMQGNTRRTGVMTDVHRRFLQLLMTHGVLEECDVKRLQKHCYKVHDCNATVEKLEDFINTINSVLESLYIEIKKGVTEDDGRPIYALVNLATTSVSKMASDFAENELDLFRKALELIIDSDTGFASSTNILNLVDQLKGKKMRKKEAEHVLQKFVQNKWLIEKEGEFTLHGRAILEMDQYIRETYPDAVKVCNICRSLLIQKSSTPKRRGRPVCPDRTKGPRGLGSTSQAPAFGGVTACPIWKRGISFTGSSSRPHPSCPGTVQALLTPHALSSAAQSPSSPRHSCPRTPAAAAGSTFLKSHCQFRIPGPSGFYSDVHCDVSI